MPRWKVYKGNLRRFETNSSPLILKSLFEKYSILDYGHKWMLKGWNNIYIYICKYVCVCKLLCKLSLCVLLQDDQSTPWSSVKPNGRWEPHISMNTEQHLGSEKNTQYENDDRSQHSWNNNHTKI